jgi:predicted metal-dependent peptidase
MNIDTLSVQIIKNEQCPAPGWVKNGVIHINESLNDHEKNVILKHELGHILLQHIEQAIAHNHEPELANIAGDCEIALALYDSQDEQAINQPRSQLNNGITREFVEQHAPGKTTYLEIYKALKKNKNFQVKENFSTLSLLASSQGEQAGKPGESQASGGDKKSGGGKKSGGAGKPVSKKAIKKILKKLKEQLRSQSNKIKVGRVKPSPPRKGVNEYVEQAVIEAIGRIKNYRRPARRESPFILKGRSNIISKPRISLYLDRSGSFTPEKTREAEDKIKKIAKRHEAILELDSFEFSDDLGKTVNHGQGTNYALVAEHIADTKPRIAIVLTDNDGCPKLTPSPKGTQVLVVPIGTTTSSFATEIKAELVNMP